jgi:hypothetical protein
MSLTKILEKNYGPLPELDVKWHHWPLLSQNWPMNHMPKMAANNTESLSIHHYPNYPLPPHLRSCSPQAAQLVLA